jgi:large subunit ribosomal protein L4
MSTSRPGCPRRPVGTRGALKLESPKTKVLADKFKAMNLESVMVIAEEVDENLYLASRNLKNVFVVEPRYADRLHRLR